MKNTIIQWNCRGLRANYDELQLLLTDYDPAVVCLQETYLKEPNNVTFRNYNLIDKFAIGEGRGTGGNTIIINKRCPSRQIQLKTILVGDFNGHNVIWCSDDVNERGRIIEKFININDNKPTYLHPATGTYTSLDLSICYPTLLLDYKWKVHDDLCGSDHFPLFLNNIASGLEEPSEKWKLNKADWPSFKALCESEINETILKAKDPIDNFTTILYEIEEKTIPKTSTKTMKKKKPWFNDDCKISIQKRRQALR